MKSTGVLLALAFAAALGHSAETPPGWLTEVVTREVPAYDSDVEAVVLFEEETVRVGENGRITVTRRGAIRVLQRAGDRRAFEQVAYTTDTDRVRSLEGWIIFAGGGQRHLGKRDVVEGSIGGISLYDESRHQTISARGQADPGTVFGFESVLERRRIFAQLSHGFQRDLPVLTARYNLELPSGWTAKSTTFNAPEIQPLVQGSSYSWQMTNLEPIHRELLSPTYSALAPRVAITYFPPGGGGEMSFDSWSDVGAWTDSLSEPHVAPDQTVSARAQELTQSSAGEWDRLSAIADFAQSITYVSIQIGTGTGGGYTPHPAPQILQNLFGDCKDKVTLTRSLLRALDVPTYQVLIYSGDRRYVREEWPSPHQFNHVIAAISVSDEVDAPSIVEAEGFGRLLLFDPTDPYTPLGELPDHEQDAWALLAAPTGGVLLRTPASEPDDNSITRDAIVELSANGNIHASMSERAVGSSARFNRALHRETSTNEYRGIIERWIVRGAPAAQVESLEVEDSAGSEFELSVAFAASGYAQSIAQRLLVFRPAIVGRRRGTYLTDDEREHPVLLDAEAFTETTRFVLPEGYSLDEKPENVELTTSFGSYAASWELDEEGALVFRRELSVSNADVEPENYPEVRDFFRQVAGAEQAPVVLAR